MNKDNGRSLPRPRTDLDFSNHETAYESQNKWLEKNTGMPYEDTDEIYGEDSEDDLMPSPESEVGLSDWSDAAETLNNSYPARTD